MQKPIPIQLTEAEASGPLNTLCVQLGFCLPPNWQSRLAKNPPTNPVKFADTVYKIEGLDFSLHSGLYYQVRSYGEAAFKLHVGQETPNYNV